MTHDLPPQLLAAIAGHLAGSTGASLKRATAGLTDTYRRGGVSAPDMDFAAYLATRLPATFAAVDAVLSELHARFPAFSPLSLLDAGSGPGTAAWAAASRWPDLGQVTFLDNNPAFLHLARQLAAAGPTVLQGAAAQVGSLLQPPGAADLVIAAYALAELSERESGPAATALWAVARGALVLVEPGTPQGFARIKAAREALLGAGAALVAPCPGAGFCPMRDGDWCHFSVRLPRRRLHMLAKQATVPFEDEKFSYLIATRGGGTPATARILAPPRETKAEITAKLCTPDGLSLARVARRTGGDYKRAKKWRWGEALVDEGRDDA